MIDSTKARGCKLIPEEKVNALMADHISIDIILLDAHEI